MPAKALKAGVHGVPGGENMMALSDGSVRYFSVREAARLQGLPDDFEFVGAWSENMRQLGNAVPVELAEFVGAAMRNTIEATRKPRRRRAA
jgi:DNA (cytosine-5)-methyltransferase 1